MVLSVSHLSHAYGPHVVLDDLSFSINALDRVGLVGINGAGKSTLLRLIIGEEAADSGVITLAPSIEVGYLPQTIPDFPGHTLDDLLHESVGRLRRLETRMRELEAAMASASEVDLPALLDEYGTVTMQFQDRGGYDLDYQIDAVLAGLQIAHIARERPITTLSGGERSRVGLAAILLHSPDLLVLDEPTNHLDFAIADWLEAYLKTYRGTILVVSHDRQFLNRTVNRIFEIDEHSHHLKHYSGAYDAYATAKVAELAAWEEAYQHQIEEINELRRRVREAANGLGHNRPARDNDKFIHHSKGQAVQAATGRNIHAAEELLARIEADPIPKPPKPLRFQPRFNAEALRSDTVLRVEGVNKAYGDRLVLRDVSLSVEAGARIMLTGPNGAGKTTLLRIMLGYEFPDRGMTHIVNSAQIGYLGQDPALPDLNKTVLQAYGEGLIGYEDQFVAGLLGYGFFRLEDMGKTLRQLSLGQRRKLEIARLMAARPNALILDEPTNHLSLDVMEGFEAAIMTFPGPVIVVSHDRWFIERFGGEVWELQEGLLMKRI